MHLRQQKQAPPPPQTLMEIPGGAAGIKETLKLMRKLVRAGKKHPLIREKAKQLTQHLKQKDRLGEVNSLFKFVRDRIRYVRDINGVETLHEPQQVLLQKSGDCDDKCLLLASLLESIGYPTRFVAIGPRPGVFSHVFVQVRPFGAWISLETTNPVKMGYEPKGVGKPLICHNCNS